MTTKPSLPATVVAEDKQLCDAADDLDKSLAELRWHWTIDESNPERVSIRDYAATVDRSYTTIHNMIKGYQMWVDRGTPIGELPDCIALAGMSGLQALATKVVADGRGVTVEVARRQHRPEIRDVLGEAAIAAEDNQMSIEDTIPLVTEGRYRKLKDKPDPLRKPKEPEPSPLFREIERKFAAADRALSKIHELMMSADLTEDDLETLTDAAGGIQELYTKIIHQIESAIHEKDLAGTRQNYSENEEEDEEEPIDPADYEEEPTGGDEEEEE